MEYPEVYDAEGTRRDWAWLIAKYPGTQYVRAVRSPAYRLVRVRESKDVTVAVARVMTEEGTAAFERVCLFWDTGSKPVPTTSRTIYWPNVGAISMSDAITGRTEFGIGAGSFYNPDARLPDGTLVGGPYWIWVASDIAYSDALARYGWLPGTNHWGPCSMDFRLVDEDDNPPTPEPGTGLWSRFVAWLKRLWASIFG